ncbi:MAG: DNA polymerase I [Thermomicrobiales bacterium]
MTTTDTHTTTDQRPTLLLVDGFGLIFRAYHALPPTLTTSTGEQVNAVFGFATMLLDVIRAQNPDYAVIALEGGRTFRHDAYEGYKATRAETPEDLNQQIGRVRQLIDTLHIPIEERDGYEADDVIGSLSTSCARDAGVQVLIVTGDSDLLQLVDDHVTVVLPGARRFGELRWFDRAAVLERYGFGPELVPDYKALVGDTSDNILGVPGIGEKTATALIARFGDLEEIIAHLDEVTPTRARNALEANVDQARESKRLATIVRDLDIPFDLERSTIANYDRDAAIDLFRELEFRTLVGKLPQPEAEAPRRPERPPSVRQIVRTEEELRALVDRVRATRTYAFDVETTSTNPMRAQLVGIAIAVSPQEGYYIPVGHLDEIQLTIETVRQALDPVMTDASISGYAHHGKYDVLVLQRHGFSVTNMTFDTMIAAYLLGESSAGLKHLAFTRLGIQMTEISALIGTGRNQLTMDHVPGDQAGDYACGDVESTYALTEELGPELGEKGVQELFSDIELPLVPVLVEMERTGIAIDSAYLAAFSTEITERISELEHEIHGHADRSFNINSTRQLATLLFDELKLKSGRRTKTGYSVDSDVLEAISSAHEIVPLILEYRSLGKLKSTYVDALPLEVNEETGRVHTSYNQTVAETGRLSSTNPNLQNIPIRTELGRRVRRAFVADTRPGHRLFEDAVLLSADYSQIELRLMAHMSGEPFLVEAFRNGEDIHAATAAVVHAVELSEVDANMRRIAKTVNFGLLYGMQAYGLSRDTGLSRAEAQQFIDQYWSRLPRVKEYFDETLQFGARHGYVQSLNGRRRIIPDLLSSNGARRAAAERKAINMPLQGTAADIMKIAMIRVEKQLRAHKRHARMLLQVHDELVLEVSKHDLDATAKLVVETMQKAYELRVPLIAEVKTGINWEEMTPFDA